jgi:hypothetical protein
MSARLRHHMILPTMSSAVGSIAPRKPDQPRIEAAVCQPVNPCGTQGWRNWAVEPGEIDPARSQYVDELLAKRRRQLEASRG